MAAACQDPAGRLLVFGVNHRSATAALRERLLIEESHRPAILEAVHALGLDESLLIATCDRLDVVALHAEPESAFALVRDVFARQARVTPDDMERQSYRHFGEAALRHVFAVAASLDSQMIGEPQVLGQVRESHRLARAGGTLGPGLEAVLQGAYATAKRVRNETLVAQRPVSIAASAMSVARNLHGDLARCNGLLLGLGEMGDLMALELKEAGVADLVVMHTSSALAEAAAHRLHCHFRPWDELAEGLMNADIVVSAVGSGRHIVTAPLAEATLKRRRRRPILFIDTAVPGEVEPGVEDRDGAFVYDLDDLEGVASQGRAAREAMAPAAWQILGEEVTAFLRQQAERTAVPAVTGLRQHFEAMREQVLAESGTDAGAATRLLINRLLHGPSETLRSVAAGDPGAARALEQAIGRLFRLDHQEAEAEDGPDEEKVR